MKRRRWKKNKVEKPKDEDVILLDELVQLEDVKGGLRKLTFGEGPDLGEAASFLGAEKGTTEGINKRRDRGGSE